MFRFLQLQFHKNPHLIKVRGNEDVIGAIEKFSAENNISLLVTIPHDHDWLESLISSSHTEKLLHMLDRPLMSLPHSKKAYIPGEDEIKYTSMPGSKYYY